MKTLDVSQTIRQYAARYFKQYTGRYEKYARYYLLRLLNATGICHPPVSREMVEEREIALLAPGAFKSRFSRGRLTPEPPCPYRTDFVRDILRIKYSEYFQFLGRKTQVFSPESLSLPIRQSIHNRLIHVMKVAGVAVVICRAKALNEDLAEAIALAHDLGHTPFGHEGERVLNDLSLKYLEKPFKHNRHSLRVVDVLEKRRHGSEVLEGLNLTFEVRDGIVRHDGEKKDPIFRPHIQADLRLDDRDFPTTLEGCVVRLSDRIAYLPMDYKDALKMEIIKPAGIPKTVKRALGEEPDKMIDILVRDVIASSYVLSPHPEDNYITMSPRSLEALDKLFDSNYKKVYFSKKKMQFVPTIESCINGLFGYYFKEFIKNDGRDEPKAAQKAIDTIVGMTDEHALHIYHQIAA